MNQKIIVLLGRTGDILSVLPVLHAEFKNGQRCALLCAKEFAGLMDGVGYADCLPFDGQPFEIDLAMAQAWQLSKDVKCIQVAGPPEMVKQHAYGPAGQENALMDSFVKEQWKMAGHFALWKTQPPLLFDRRDQAREAKLLEAFPKKKRVILVSADGHTAPFPYRDLLFKILEINFRPKFVIVDLAKFKAERIYDLLALYEKAHCLVACDSAPLHLAQACPDLPVVALANDSPSLWHGAPWRANHIAYIRYKDFAARACEMLDAIEGIGQFGTMKAVPAKVKRVIHLWSQYDVGPENIERHKAACWDWQRVYADAGNWVACRIDLRAVGRDSKTIWKDERPFPGLKEVVRLGCFRARDEDVICLTRADTCFDDKGAISDFWHFPCFARRTLREQTDGAWGSARIADTWHPVPDMFAFTKAWWLEHEKEIPDLVMGQDQHWPRVLMQLIREHGGTELPMGTIHRARNAGTVAAHARAYATHNEAKAKDWLTAHGALAMFPRVSEQVEAVRVNPMALNSGGYNPSIIRHNGQMLMAYRYHPTNGLNTQLAMAELDDKFNVTRNTNIVTGGNHQSAEDPRLFTYQGQLWISWVDADFPSPAPTSVVKVGRLVQVGNTWNIEDMRQPLREDYNQGLNIQKNWLFWESDQELAWIWKIVEGRQIAYCDDRQWASPAPHWPWGEIRGGTAPLPYQGKLLRFFHSSLDFELPPAHRRYFLGAAIMEPEPPFATVAVSKEPIVWGSELDDLSDTERSQCLPYKQKVVFPAGAIIDGDGWIVSVGCNDAECLLLKLKEKDLKLA